MNPFVSLEEALTPMMPVKSPDVGIFVEDFDENFNGVVSQFTAAGRTVEVIPVQTQDGVKPSFEDLYRGDYTGNGQPAAMVEGEPAGLPTLYYYKGKPEDESIGIPVLYVEEGKVKVSSEGRVKELAEELGLLDTDDQVGDHEYR